MNMSENIPEEKFDYTKAVAELEQIAAKMEDPATSLDDIGALVKRSKELIADCRAYLRSVRESIEDDGKE
jgi:exodeoxyribonuclease VII small subunit